jgi:hypothetical protein
LGQEKAEFHEKTSEFGRVLEDLKCSFGVKAPSLDFFAGAADFCSRGGLARARRSRARFALMTSVWVTLIA